MEKSRVEAYDWGAALNNPLANQSASSATEKVGLVYIYRRILPAACLWIDTPHRVPPLRSLNARLHFSTPHRKKR